MAASPKAKPKRKPKPRRRARTSRASQQAAPKRRKPPVSASEIRLVPGHGSAGHGAEAGGHYWHVFVGDKRVGNIFINVINEGILGRHASVQIHLNQDQRGRGIGRVAYRLACELSSHDAVYAHMRKSNTASRRAAEAAGFVALDDGGIQLSMVWRRPRPAD